MYLILNIFDVNSYEKITINNNATTGSNIFLTTTTSAGQQYSLTTKVTGTSPDSINICTKNTGPFDFNNLPVNQSITITLDSIALSGTGCTFNYSPSITFFTKPLLRRQISRSLCQGEVFIVGKDVYSETRPSGNTVIPSAIPGTCDSIIAVQLNYFSPSPVTPVIRTSCDPNFSLTVGNTIFDKNNPSGQVRLQNIRGCDSLVTVSLTFSTFAASNFSPRMCDTTVQFTVGNQTFNKANPSGTVTFTGGSISGCDSIVTVSVTYLNTPVNQIQRDLCDDSFTLTVGTTTFSKANPAGLVKLAGRAANGCDSLVNVKLNYKTLSPVTPVIRTVCDQNFRLTVGSTVFDKNNPKGQVRLQNTQGCDSLVDVNLTFSTTTTFSFTRRTCDTTEQFNVGTQTFNKANPSGMVTFTGGSISGCDSIVTVSVTYLNTPVTQIQRDLCDDSFTLTVGTTTFSKANPVGLVKLAGRAANGCDSLVNVKLNYKTLSPVTPVIRTVCDQNFRLTVGSTVFDKNNPKGQVRLQNTQGCDSLVDVNLTFSNAATSIFNPRTCDTTEQFKVGTQTFSRGNPVGTVTLTGANAQGCDSIVTVAITYLFAATSKVEQQLCNDAFTLTVGTTTFSKANPEGTVKLIGKAANGCDSILSVKLTYLAKGVQNFSKSTCLSEFTFVVGGATFSKTNPSGSVTLAGRAANGCDSIVNVQLIYSTFKATQVLQDICDGTMPQIIISQPSHPGPYDILVDNVRIPAVTSMPYNIKIDSGQHKIIISNPDGCKDSATYNVNFVPDLTVSLTQDATINGSTKISVNAPANGIWDLKWTPAATLSCNDCREPVAKTAVTTTYFLDYKYGNNCMGQKEITIKRAETRPVLPNILSHNSSGNNNIFYVTMPDQLEATVDIMDIFDRWGNVVFSARNVPANQPAAGWDGTIKNGTVMTGVYVYFVRVTTVITGESEDFSGSITVIR